MQKGLRRDIDDRCMVRLSFFFYGVHMHSFKIKTKESLRANFWGKDAKDTELGDDTSYGFFGTKLRINKGLGEDLKDTELGDDTIEWFLWYQINPYQEKKRCTTPYI